jgi:hypothetical protein
VATFRLLTVLFTLLINITIYTGIDNIQNITQYTFQYSPQLINKSEFITPGKTKQITHPGTYFLKEEVSFKSSGNNQDIISIETNNVTLILNDKTIFSDQAHLDTVAIRIKSGLSNIIIQRGTINLITGTGIVIEENCTNIAIRDTLITNCKRGGIEATSCEDCIFSNLYISQCHNNDSTKNIYGIKLTNPKNSNLKTLLVRSIKNQYKDAYGIYINNAKSTILELCETKIIEGKNSYGTYHINSKAGGLVNCYSNNISATNGDAYCFYFKNNTNLDQSKSFAESATSLTGNVYGFYMEAGKHKKLFNCTSRDCSANGGTGSAYGIFYTNGNNNDFDSCLSSGNEGGVSTTSEGAGIKLCASEKNSSIKNSKFTSNSSQAGKAYGIFLESGIKSCLIEDNEVITNSGFINGYGILDANTMSKNVYTGNFAYANGKSDSSTLNNFDIYPAPSGNVEDFPVDQIYYTSYVNLNTAFIDPHTLKKNVEILEAQ